MLFVVIAIFALLTSKRAEQNKVWVGLSKETAHQLGTPISSLMAWIEILKMNYPDDELIPEMNKDIKRFATDSRPILKDRFPARTCSCQSERGDGSCYRLHGPSYFQEGENGEGNS